MAEAAWNKRLIAQPSCLTAPQDAPVASSSQAEPFWQGLTSFVTSTKADEGEGESARTFPGD